MSSVTRGALDKSLLQVKESEIRGHLDEVVRQTVEETLNSMLSASKSAAEVCQKLEVTESTWLRWRKQFGGMRSNEAKRLLSQD